MKFTPWFPASTSPVRPGVYAVKTRISSLNKYAYWDSMGWRLCNSTVAYALTEKPFIKHIPASSMTAPSSMWRGILKEGKQ